MNVVVVRRLFVLTVCAFWLGGLTFYAAVVIPTANQVLGSHRVVGFVTQQVTEWLNVAGGVAIVTLLLNHVSSNDATGGGLRTGLWATWAALLLTQVALFLLHPVLDRMLDVSARRIVDEARFYGMHRVYLLVTMGQQASGLAHVGLLLASWRRTDLSVEQENPGPSAADVRAT